MKLSEKTTNILKNFSNINTSILFKEGNVVRTISNMKNIYAEATVDETFPRDFGVYDLPQFLNGLNLHRQAELNFDNEKYLVIKEGRSRSKFFFAAESTIVTPPDKRISLAKEEINFNIDTTQLDKLLKASAVYQAPDLSAIGKDGVVELVVRDKKNDTSNDYSVTVGETDSEFVCNFKVENLKIISGSYDVCLSSERGGIGRFKSRDYDLTYYIALEPDSVFN